MNEIITNEIKIEENEQISNETNIIQNVFMNSFITEKNIWENMKQKEENIENNEGFNINNENIINNTNKIKNRFMEIFNYRKELNLSKKVKRFHLFNKECKNPSDEKIIYKLGKVLLFTYRKNFPKIFNYKTKKTYTTDAWWGCMIRCGQMILSRGIYLMLKSKGLTTKNALSYTAPLFNEYPITKNKLHPFFYGMIEKYNKLNKNDKEEIKEFFPPFSIKTLCDIGEIFERTAGEWFSDVIISKVFKKISENFNLFTNSQFNVKILTFQSFIDMPTLLNECFVVQKKDLSNPEHMHLNGKYYYFNKMGIVFVNVRLGLDKIPVEYYRGIRELFQLKSCIGIIGGKTRLAYYFIGYNDDENSLLYLDPHVTKDSDKEVTLDNILSKHINKEIHLLKMTKMSTAFTIGFCFTKYSEFLELYHFWQKAEKNEKVVKILGLSKKDMNYVVHKENEEDISPTYDDKDEDDF
jgi:cysteine protease ATG4